MTAFSTTKYLLIGQISFFAALLLCCLQLYNETLLTDGISYFGVHHETILPYLAGFGVAAWALYRAGSKRLSSVEGRGLQKSFRALAVVLLGVALTPYTYGAVFNGLHRLFGGLFFVGILLLTGWLTIWVDHRPLLMTLLVVQVFGAGVAALSVPDWLHAMFFGQVISLVAFAPLVTLHVAQMERRLAMPAEIVTEQ